MTTIDFSRLNAEINEEVRRRRASGDFPPGLERELDSLFARYAPATTGGDFDEVLERAERTSFIHADVPTASNRRGLSYLKRALRSLMAWYLRFIASEVTAFAGAITRSVRLLGRRVETLETMTVKAAERSLLDLGERRAAVDLGAWLEVVSAALQEVKGRVLHVECGEGTLLSRLVADGRDAYGVEPSERLAMSAARAGLDVRGDDPLAHLHALPDGALAGLVLTGLVDALPLGGLLELADLAAGKLAPGGVLVIVSSGAWATVADPVVADLSPGRPLHPQTWQHLLTARGFVEPVVTVAAPTGGLEPVPASAPSADVLNANIDRLNRLLFAASPYAVTAHRS
jgi:hypothetical protein